MSSLALRQHAELTDVVGEVVTDLSKTLRELGLNAPASRMQDPAPAQSPSRDVASESGPARSRGRFVVAARHIFNLACAAVLALALAAAGLIAAAVTTGHHLETVVTGSMQPVIPIGAMVMTERVPAAQLRTGDIIAFPQPCTASRIIVHRIVHDELDASGQVAVRTKGDANPGPDQWPGSCSSLTSTGLIVSAAQAKVDRVVYVLAAVGSWLDVGRRYALLALIGIGGLVIVEIGLREIRRFRARVAQVSDRTTEGASV